MKTTKTLFVFLLNTLLVAPVARASCPTLSGTYECVGGTFGPSTLTITQSATESQVAYDFIEEYLESGKLVSFKLVAPTNKIERGERHEVWCGSNTLISKVTSSVDQTADVVIQTTYIRTSQSQIAYTYQSSFGRIGTTRTVSCSMTRSSPGTVGMNREPLTVF